MMIGPPYPATRRGWFPADNESRELQEIFSRMAEDSQAHQQHRLALMARSFRQTERIYAEAEEESRRLQASLPVPQLFGSASSALAETAPTATTDGEVITDLAYLAALNPTQMDQLGLDPEVVKMYLQNPGSVPPPRRGMTRTLAYGGANNYLLATR